MVNVVEYSFEIHLLQLKRFVTFYHALNLFVCFCTWSECDKLYNSEFDYDLPSKDDKTSQSLMMLTRLQMLEVFRGFTSSDASDLQMFLNEIPLVIQKLTF